MLCRLKLSTVSLGTDYLGNYLKMGVTGKFYDLIRYIYEGDQVCIKLDNAITPAIKTVGSEEGLNKLLGQLNAYSNLNQLKINTDKTKCMIFNKTGRLIRRNFFLGSVKLENVL